MQKQSSDYDDSHLRHLAEIYDYVAMVTNPGAFTMQPTTFTKVPFQTVLYDPCKMWDADLKAFRIPFTGLWRVEGVMRVEATGGSYRYILEAGLNGTTVDADYGRRLADGIYGGGFQIGGGNQVNGNGVHGNEEIYFREGDILEPFFWHSIPSARAYPVSVDPKDNHFAIRAVRRIELGALPLMPY